MNRRDFIKQSVIAGVGCSMPGWAFGKSAGEELSSGTELIWGCLLHLSFNMWEEYISPHRPFRGYRPYLRMDEALWNDAISAMAKAKVNTVVIDLGDAVAYESHPEIAVKGAWTPHRLKSELSKIRTMGIQPIPKLNFSAGHDTWMKEYSRMVSTDTYYRVCADLIREVSALFDTPPLFHLGMDEETAEHQSHYQFVVMRQNDAWWHDFYFLVDEVEKNGSQAWIWSDYMLWRQPETFFRKMPTTVVQSNWYYGEEFNLEFPYVKAYLDLEKHGYTQIPTGSYHADNQLNIKNTVAFAEKFISRNLLKGFLQTCWKPTIEEYRTKILKGIALMGEAIHTLPADS